MAQKSGHFGLQNLGVTAAMQSIRCNNSREPFDRDLLWHVDDVLLDMSSAILIK